MRSIDKECISSVEWPLIKFVERGKKMIFANPGRKRCLKVQVDGCAIKEGDKCDNLLKIDTDCGGEYYVELKGTDVAHALVQVEETIKKLHNDASPVNAYIISTNVSPALTTKIQLFKVKFKKKYNANLKVKERICEETI